MSAPKYTLLYHPKIPGRGEYIRLAFEATGTAYLDAANASDQGKNEVYSLIDVNSTGHAGNPPFFAPPMLKIAGANNGNDLIISQTPNILLYLGKQLGLAGENPDVDIYQVNGLALTALDISNEAHDTHHPIASSQYYEDQKEESLKKAKNFREERLPKFLDYFERVLKGNETAGNGNYLVSGKLTYADLTLWQTLDGLMHAFPKEMEHQSKNYSLLTQRFYPAIKKILRDYLASERRLKYSMGIFRHYTELDRST